MLRKLELIKKKYDDYTNSLLKQGKLPLRRTEKGFWGNSVHDEVFELFNKIKLEKYKSFIDLGSGDGRVVLIASLFTNAKGIEVDKELIEKSRQFNKELKLDAEFIHNDFYEYDIKDYDVVYSFPDTSINSGLQEKLMKELNGKFILYGAHLFPIQLKKHDEFFVQGTKVGVYTKG